MNAQFIFHGEVRICHDLRISMSWNSEKKKTLQSKWLKEVYYKIRQFNKSGVVFILFYIFIFENKQHSHSTEVQRHYSAIFIPKSHDSFCWPKIFNQELWLGHV